MEPLAPSTAMPMSWKNQGEYHLNRKEFDLATDSFTKALQEAEEQCRIDYIHPKKGSLESWVLRDHQEKRIDVEEHRISTIIAEKLKDLGRVFLEKEQWTFSAKIFNGPSQFY